MPGKVSSMIDRRLFVAGAVATAATSTLAKAGGRTSSFPPGFLWGAATAGHQIEGNNVNSDYWVLENVKPTLFAEPSGDANNSLSYGPATSIWRARSG
jgi:beta-glucosidase